MAFSICGAAVARDSEGRRNRMADSKSMKTKSMDSPDETRTFDNDKMGMVNIDEVTAGRVTLEPG
jgi:hypothetical protein